MGMPIGTIVNGTWIMTEIDYKPYYFPVGPILNFMFIFGIYILFFAIYRFYKFIRKKEEEVFFIDPNKVFNTEGPSIKINHLDNWQYYDKDGIGMSNYLQVLTSIALYGIKYAVPITRGFKSMDGNFRVYAAKELGIELPVIFVEHDSENRHPFIYKWLWRFRKIIKRKHFLKRKWINPKWKWKNKKIVLVTNWQRNIF